MRLFVQGLTVSFFVFFASYASASYLTIYKQKIDDCGSGSQSYNNNWLLHTKNECELYTGKDCTTEIKSNGNQGCGGSSFPNYQSWKYIVYVDNSVKPEECFETGQVWNPVTKQCTLNCPNGQLNGQCLENPESNCGPDSPDYMGAIGPGGSAVCESQFNECQGGGGQLGIFNGNSVCISDDYGPPTLCGPGQISVFDSYGFTCAPIVGSENGNPQWQDGELKEDTDGDGVPDRFNPNLVNSSEMLQLVGGNIFNQNNHIINQNNITNHNLTNINNSVNNLNQTINQQGEQANQNLEGIAGILGQIAGDVSDIATNGIPGTGGGDGGDGGDGGTGGDGTGEGEGVELGTIEGLLGDANDKQDGTNEKLDKIINGEEGGLSTEGLGDAPGFGDSIGRLQTAFFDHPTIQKVTTLPSLAEGSSCPVFTIPANDYWDALTMDMHCTVLEDYRGMLSGMFLFFWTVLAIFAFLRA